MYKLDDCIRIGLFLGASLGAAIEAWIAIQGGNATAVQLLIRSAYGIAHASVVN